MVDIYSWVVKTVEEGLTKDLSSAIKSVATGGLEEGIKRANKQLIDGVGTGTNTNFLYTANQVDTKTSASGLSAKLNIQSKFLSEMAVFANGLRDANLWISRHGGDDPANYIFDNYFNKGIYALPQYANTWASNHKNGYTGRGWLNNVNTNYLSGVNLESLFSESIPPTWEAYIDKIIDQILSNL